MYPALAVVDALGERADVLWVGGRGGMEADLVSRTGLAYEAIPAAGVHGVGLRRLPGNLWRLTEGTLAARSLLRRFDPEVLFFTGGYVGVPAALAGIGRPKLTFVPDIEPGLAQRLISRLADRICVPTEDARRFYPRPDKVEVTGYPTRFEDYSADQAQARSRLGLTSELPVLLVVGGSKGARSINQAIWQQLSSLLSVTQIVHVVGQRDWPMLEPATADIEGSLRRRYQPHSYLHEEMADALCAADLVVSRAGASALAEYPLFGLPAVLVPYPHAWRYQRVNAAHLADRGAALVVDDEDLETELEPLLVELLNQPARLSAMSTAASELAQPGAADRIAAELLELAAREARS